MRKLPLAKRITVADLHNWMIANRSGENSRSNAAKMFPPVCLGRRALPVAHRHLWDSWLLRDGQAVLRYL